MFYKRAPLVGFEVSDLDVQICASQLKVIAGKLKEAGSEYNEREVLMHAGELAALSVEQLRSVSGRDIDAAISRDIKNRYKNI